MSMIKTAISIQESLFERAEQLAREMNLSRSALIGLAIEEFLQRHQNRRMLRELNAAYETGPDPAEEARLAKSRRSQRRTVEGEW